MKRMQCLTFSGFVAFDRYNQIRIHCRTPRRTCVCGCDTRCARPYLTSKRCCLCSHPLSRRDSHTNQRSSPSARLHTRIAQRGALCSSPTIMPLVRFATPESSERAHTTRRRMYWRMGGLRLASHTQRM